jgi:hypothetical protein
MLITFTDLRKKLNEATISTSEKDSDRHFEQYVRPYLPGNEKHGKNTHKLAKDHDGIKAGEKLTVYGHKTIDGKRHTLVSAESSPHKKLHVPNSKITKPEGSSKNKGINYEGDLINHLKKHGLMHSNDAGAGGGSGNDFYLHDKNKHVNHHGKHTGEVKQGKSAAFGQITLKHDDKKGWHVPDSGRENRKHFAASLENAHVTGSDGKKKKFLQHLNDTVKPQGKKGHNKSQNEYSDDQDLGPIHHYLKDHHVGIIHIGTHGTYRGGEYQKHDKTGVGFPELKGKGKFRARFRNNRPGIFVEFKPKHIDSKSHLDLMNSEHIKEIRHKLGHK